MSGPVGRVLRWPLAATELAARQPVVGAAVRAGAAVPAGAARNVRRRFRVRVSGDPSGVPEWVQAVRTQGGGAGWFEPDGVVWRVHGDLSTLVGGITALLGQAAHPLAVAGVQQHSAYRDDPWKRLAGTARWLVVTTFGSEELARQEAARVRALHRRVAGQGDDGRPYAASDPVLLRWVHLAFTDAFLHAHLHLGSDLRPAFGPRWPDTYVAQWARSARELGATDLPSTAAELDAAIRGLRPQLDEVPGDLRSFLVAPPGLALVERPLYAALVRGAGVLVHPALAPLAKVPGRGALGRSPRAALDLALARAELSGLRLVLGGRSPAERAAQERLARHGEGPRDVSE